MYEDTRAGLDVITLIWKKISLRLIFIEYMMKI
jgi:hypothetical protein